MAPTSASGFSFASSATASSTPSLASTGGIFGSLGGASGGAASSGGFSFAGATTSSSQGGGPSFSIPAKTSAPSTPATSAPSTGEYIGFDNASSLLLSTICDASRSTSFGCC
jgi:hypothetical protein